MAEEEADEEAVEVADEVADEAVTISGVGGGEALDTPKHILIRPSSSREDLSSSSGSDDDSVLAFESRGHQGSYFLRKAS